LSTNQPAPCGATPFPTGPRGASLLMEPVYQSHSGADNRTSTRRVRPLASSTVDAILYLQHCFQRKEWTTWWFLIDASGWLSRF